MSSLIPLNTSTTKRYLTLDGLETSPLGHGLAVHNYLEARLVVPAEGSGKGPKSRKDDKFKAGDIVQISFGNVRSSRYELLLSPSSELHTFAAVSAPSVLPPKNAGEVVVGCIFFKDCDLRSISSLLSLYLVD